MKRRFRTSIKSSLGPERALQIRTANAEIQRLSCSCPQKQCGQVRPLSVPGNGVTGSALEAQFTLFCTGVQTIPSSWPNLPEAQERERRREDYKLTNPGETALSSDEFLVFLSSSTPLLSFNYFGISHLEERPFFSLKSRLKIPSLGLIQS